MRRILFSSLLAGILVISWAAAQQHDSEPVGYRDTPQLPGQKWKVHDIDRPHPRMVTPGSQPGAPPSDAIVLFDGKNLSKWDNIGKKGQVTPASWKVGNGYFECVGGTGDLVTKEKFGDIQLHIEWASPEVIKGSSQSRGNSGVLIMHRYEIQVLDSWNNLTYADGQAGSIYGQWPPLVNASRPTGQYNVYDIVFKAPKFEGGKVVKPAYATVFENGILLHDHQEIIGGMVHRQVAHYEPHAAEEPLGLQDHGTPVRYRNIWVRKLTGYDQQ